MVSELQVEERVKMMDMMAKCASQEERGEQKEGKREGGREGGREGRGQCVAIYISCDQLWLHALCACKHFTLLATDVLY